MGTLKKLATIDESDFETLVARYLRQRDPQLKGLIQTGINAEGKSIKCPVDGVLYIPSDPPILVYVAVTVFEMGSGLRRKWLGGPKGKQPEPGDIKRAEDQFTEFEKKVLGAKRKLYLATNRPLENNTDLYTEAVARCKASNIEVEIIEASQLVGFLDQDPEGLYLRQEFLGIDAGRLSESLLRQIAHKSLVQHQETFGIQSPVYRMEITREAERRLSDVVERSNVPLIGVRGASGAGKSTLGRQYGVKINNRGGICLWAPAEELARNVSPAALLLGILRRFQPLLNDHAGDDALDVAAKIPGGIVLFADDVNRLEMPHGALEAAQVFVRAEARERSSGEQPPRVRFIMPLWPEQLAGQSEAEKAGWEVIDLGFYTALERRELAGACETDRSVQLLSLIDSLNGDPFLCGLALAEQARVTMERGADHGSIVKGLIEGVLRSAAREAIRLGSINATADEFDAALKQLIELMLQTERPEPAMREVRSALGDRKTELLLILGETNQIGWVEMRLEDSHWRWKHDRLRDALVGRSLTMNVVPRLTRDSQEEEPGKLLRLPGAADAWAWSLAFAAPDRRELLASLLADHNPLALVEALTIVRFPEGTALRTTVVDGIRRAMEGFDPGQESFVTSPQWPILRRLTLTDDPMVIEVTEHMDRNWHVCLGRFRNGDTQAGLRLMRQQRVGMTFHPAVRFPTLERAVESYARAMEGKHDEVSKDLVQAANKAENVVAVLTLCGYLAWGELAQTAWDVWSALDDDARQATVVPMVWTLSRCADETMQDKLEEVLLRVRAWSDEERVEGNVHHSSNRYNYFVEPLLFVFRWRITTASAVTWARVTTEQEDLRNTFLILLRELDQPVAVEAYVRLTSKFGGSFLDSMAAVEHHDGRDSDEKVPVTAAARERLWQIISSEESEDTRKVAFWLWKRFPMSEDLERLGGIEEEDALFNDALQIRLRLRDRIAAPLLIKRMNAVPGAWCPYAYTLYFEEGVADSLFNNLEAALKSDVVERQYVERLPQNLPHDGIGRLVREKREVLLKSPRMWNPLWRSDAPEAMEFLQKVIPQADSKDLSYMFRLTSGNAYPLSQRMLDAVAPLLHFFSEEDLRSLTDVVINAGRADWAEANGLERVTHIDLRKSPQQEETVGGINLTGEWRHWLNEDDAINILNAAAQAVPNGARQVERTEDFYDLESPSKKLSFDIRGVLRRWLGSSAEPNRLIVASMLLATIGTGDDVEWWRALEPDTRSDAHEPWANAMYSLRRRRWHRSDQAAS